MINLNKNFLIIFLCFALLGFAFFSLGGDFLHGQIHDHEQGTEQECPFYQFLVQALILIVVVIAALKIKVQYQSENSYQLATSKVHLSLPSLRAPPIV